MRCHLTGPEMGCSFVCSFGPMVLWQAPEEGDMVDIQQLRSKKLFKPSPTTRSKRLNVQCPEDDSYCNWPVCYVRGFLWYSLWSLNVTFLAHFIVPRFTGGNRTRSQTEHCACWEHRLNLCLCQNGQPLFDVLVSAKSGIPRITMCLPTSPDLPEALLPKYPSLFA